MSLQARLSRLEGRTKPFGVLEPRFMLDAAGDAVEAVCATARNGSFSVFRHPQEDGDTFRLKAKALSGDLASTQHYVLNVLAKVHSHK